MIRLIGYSIQKSGEIPVPVFLKRVPKTNRNETPKKEESNFEIISTER